MFARLSWTQLNEDDQQREQNLNNFQHALKELIGSNNEQNDTRSLTNFSDRLRPKVKNRTMDLSPRAPRK